MLRLICLFSLLLPIYANAEIDSLKVDTLVTESQSSEANEIEMRVDTVLYQGRIGLDQYLSADDSTNLEMHLYQNPTVALFKSAILPGFGQLGNRRYLKAVIFSGLSAWMIGSALHYRSQASDFKSAYDNATDINVRNEYYGLYTDRRDARNKFTWYAGIVAFVSMFDAYVDAHLSGFPDKSRTKDFSLVVAPDTSGGVTAQLHLRF